MAATPTPKAAKHWTEEEDRILQDVIEQQTCGDDKKKIDWHHVASYIPGRNNKDCRKRWRYALVPTMKKGPWSKEEDDLLLEGVRQYKFKWVVPSPFCTLTQEGTEEGWRESLNPNINHGRWSLLEDQVLKEAVQLYGRRWTEIVERYFPDRTPIAAKNRYAQRFDGKNKARAGTGTGTGTAPTAASFDDQDGTGTGMTNDGSTPSTTTPLSSVQDAGEIIINNNSSSTGQPEPSVLWSMLDHSQTGRALAAAGGGGGNMSHNVSVFEPAPPPPPPLSFSTAPDDQAASQLLLPPSCLDDLSHSTPAPPTSVVERHQGIISGAAAAAGLPGLLGCYDLDQQDLQMGQVFCQPGFEGNWYE
ncbi:hypothetical protein DV738_g1479, partial [Chaetothyriales sp. CBS 135597]